MSTRRTGLVVALWTGIAVLWACGGPGADDTLTKQAADPREAAYVVEGLEVRLVAGRAEAPSAPGSVARIRTSIFGSPVFGDLDGDGDDDAALLLVREPGGSGTFYYVAAALYSEGACRGTNAVLLGDRIAPQNIAIRDGLIVANYADRRPGEPMAVPPSEGRTTFLSLRDGALTAVGPPR